MPKKAEDVKPTLKVVIGGIVKTSIEKVDKDAELVAYCYEGEAAKDDLFCVIHDKKLAYLKATRVINRFEYVASKYNGVKLDDLKFVIQRVDIDGYKFGRKVRARIKELQTALAERIDEARTAKGLEEVVGGLKGQKKTDIQALMAMIDQLKENPVEALAEEE